MDKEHKLMPERALVELADAWRPIETAPKDQTLIDVWVPTKNGGVRVTDVERTGIDTWGLFDNGNFWEYKKPTHWMPLPAPPRRGPNVEANRPKTAQEKA